MSTTIEIVSAGQSTFIGTNDVPDTNVSVATTLVNIATPTTIAQLRTITLPTTIALYMVTDRLKQGLFYYDSSDTTTADNGATTIINGTKRFKRIFTGGADIRWFGCDPALANNSPYLQDAFDYSGLYGKKIFIPGYTFTYTTGLLINNNEFFAEGEGENVSILQYTGTAFVDAVATKDGTVNRGVKLRNFRISGGLPGLGHARYCFYALQFNRSCQMTGMKLRDGVGIIKIEHGYYSTITDNFWQNSVADAEAAGISKANWSQVYQVSGTPTAPIYLGEMNGSDVSGNRIAEVQTKIYDGSTARQIVYTWGSGATFNRNTIETINQDPAYHSTLIVAFDNAQYDVGAIYLEAVKCDSYIFYADHATWLNFTAGSYYNVNANTLYYNSGIGKISIRGATLGNRLMIKRLWEVNNAYSSEQYISFDFASYISGDRVTDAAINAYANNVFDSYGDWPYGAADGINLYEVFYENYRRKHFIKVVSGYTVASGTDANGKYILVDCGQAVLEDSSMVSANLYANGNDPTTVKIKMKLRPNVVSKFYRVFINKGGGVYLVESTDAFSHATGNWIASFQTDGSGNITSLTANPRLTQNGTYLQYSEMVRANGTGSPEGVIAAPVGSYYFRENGSTGTTFYVKETGGITANGWAAK